MTNYGTFDIPTMKLDNKNERVLYEQRRLVSNTDEISAKLGTNFGFNYVIVGEPDGETVLVKEIIKYPMPRMFYNNKTLLADTSEFYVKLNALS